MNNKYDASSIKVLSDIEHIKKRKGLYIGEATHPGHLFYEIFDNAADEFMANPSNPIAISIDYDKNVYSIRDYGRGIPHGTMKLDDGTEKEVIEVIYTKLNSGGKFDNNAYKISSGLHGQGSTAVNALSKYLKATSYRDGKYVKVEFNKGIFSDLNKGVSGEKNGTEVEFSPDSEFFENPKIPKDFIVNRCKISSAFGIKTNLIIGNEKVDTEADIYSLIKEDEDISIFTKFDSKVELDNGESFVFAIEYTNDTSCRNKSYTNLIPNSQGGTHVRIFEKAFEKAWSNFKIERILPKDLYLGLRFVVAAFISETEFSSQTKDRLTVNKSNLEHFIDPISDKIYNFLKENDEVREVLIKRFQEHRDSLNKLMSKKEIKDWIVINEDTSGSVRRKSVVSKLIECSSRNREGTELFIVEGDSAAGSLVQARNVKTQAIIPIRGKILNTSKFGGDLVRCVKNEEIRSISNAAGTGIGDECDSSRSRYSKYIISADADVDGLQICSLVTSMFINVLPDVVKAGLLFIANPPLYEWYDSKGNYCFTNNQNEIPSGVKYSRNKGLGEMDPPELYQSIMNPETRILTQVKYPEDINRFNEILTSPSAKYDILYNLGLIKYIDD